MQTSANHELPLVTQENPTLRIRLSLRVLVTALAGWWATPDCGATAPVHYCSIIEAARRDPALERERFTR